jgi:ribosomal protein L37AE/L43A
MNIKRVDELCPKCKKRLVTTLLRNAFYISKRCSHCVTDWKKKGFHKNATIIKIEDFIVLDILQKSDGKQIIVGTNKGGPL